MSTTGTSSLEPTVTNWVWPILSSKRPPAIGTGVYIFYLGGDPEYPVWIGEFSEEPQGVFSYGAFTSTQTQTPTSINTEKIITYNVTDSSQGVTLSGNQIKVDYDGTYNFMFSIQFHHETGGGDNQYESAYVWFKKNGTSIANSATSVTLRKEDYNSMTVNLFIPMKKSDYAQLAWSATSTSMLLSAISAASPHPTVPSVILTVNQIA